MTVLEGAIQSAVNGGETKTSSPGRTSPSCRATATTSAPTPARPEPAKLLAVFVVDTDDTALTTPRKPCATCHQTYPSPSTSNDGFSGERRTVSTRKENTMSCMNWSEVAPEGAKALFGVHHYVTKKNEPAREELIHLVFLRVSQINGCVPIASTCIVAICARRCPSIRSRLFLSGMRCSPV